MLAEKRKEEKISGVLELFCRYTKKNEKFNCNIWREITTLEGNKIINEEWGEFNHVAVGSTAIHETELVRGEVKEQVVRIHFIKPPVTCHIEAWEDRWGKGKQLKCIDWDKE